MSRKGRYQRIELYLKGKKIPRGFCKILVTVARYVNKFSKYFPKIEYFTFVKSRQYFSVNLYLKYDLFSVTILFLPFLYLLIFTYFNTTRLKLFSTTHKKIDTIISSWLLRAASEEKTTAATVTDKMQNASYPVPKNQIGTVAIGDSGNLKAIEYCKCMHVCSSSGPI